MQSFLLLSLTTGVLKWTVGQPRGRGAILLAPRLAQPAAALLAGPDEDQHAAAPVVARPYRVVPVVLALHGHSTVGACLHL